MGRTGGMSRIGKPSTQLSVPRAALVVALLSLPALPALPALSAQPLDRLSGKVLIAQAPAGKRRRPCRSDLRLRRRRFSRPENLRDAHKREGRLGAARVQGRRVAVRRRRRPDHLPDAIALPFNLVAPPGSGIAGMGPSWHPILRPTPMPAERDRSAARATRSNAVRADTAGARDAAAGAVCRTAAIRPCSSRPGASAC